MDQISIAQLKETERELEKANAYLENIFENSPDAIGIVDKYGKFIKWNKMAAELYGYTFEELLGKSSFDLYADMEELRKMRLHLRKEGSAKKWAMQMKRKDGTVVPFEISISLLKDDAGRTLGSVCVARDLSEIKKVLAELKASNEQLSQEISIRTEAEDEVRRLSRQNQLILNAAGEGIVGLDVLGRVTFVNPSAAETTGYGVFELVGKDFHGLVHHSRPDGSRYPLHESPIHKSLSTGVIHRERDEVFWRKDGSSYSVAYSSTPIIEKGQIVGAVITFRDVTQRKRALEKLSKYRDHLKLQVTLRTEEINDLRDQLAKAVEGRKKAEEQLKLGSEGASCASGEKSALD